MAIWQARLEPLALSASGHEEVVSGAEGSELVVTEKRARFNDERLR